MGRFLGVLPLLLLAAGCSARPGFVPAGEPTDWLELHVAGEASLAVYPVPLDYRSHPTDVVVRFRNAGDRTVAKPTIKFKINPNDYNGVALTIVISADGDGWNCDVERDSATCAHSADVLPGEELPQIDIGVDFEWENDGRGYMADYFEVTVGDVVFKGTIAYNTSV